MPLGIDIFRFEQRFGQEVVTGLSWDILLVFGLIASMVFLVHFVVRELLNPTGHTVGDDEPSPEETEERLRAQGVDEVQRFSVAQRASHWVMAIAIFALLLSGFVIMNNDVTVRALPGLSWLLIHEITAIVLIGYVFFHVGHVATKGTWDEMWFGVRDVKDQLVRLKNFFGMTDEYPRQLKYPGAQKILHWAITGVTFGLILTGLVLLRRVPFEPLWSATREFTFLGVTFGLGSAAQLGLVAWSFVLHDFFAVGMVALVMGHVYFALRPQEWDVTKSMITGTVSVQGYAEKYAPSSWVVEGDTAADGGDETDGER